MDIAVAKKRCEAGVPTRGWTSSGNRYLTEKGEDYYRQLRIDCAAALEALEEAQGKLEAVAAVANGVPHPLTRALLDRILRGSKEDE